MRHIFLLLTLLVLIITACSGGKPAERKLTGNVERGETLFTKGTDQAPACSTCHTTSTAARRTGFHGGPTVAGISEKLEKRGLDLTPHQYIEQSIVEPDAYIVSGYSNMMFPNYGEAFSKQQIADLVAYILTLDTPATS
jgi:cytochrome c553